MTHACRPSITLSVPHSLPYRCRPPMRTPGNSVTLAADPLGTRHSPLRLVCSLLHHKAALFLPGLGGHSADCTASEYSPHIVYSFQPLLLLLLLLILFIYLFLYISSVPQRSLTLTGTRQKPAHTTNLTLTCSYQKSQPADITHTRPTGCHIQSPLSSGCHARNLARRRASGTSVQAIQHLPVPDKLPLTHSRPNSLGPQGLYTAILPQFPRTNCWSRQLLPTLSTGLPSRCPDRLCLSLHHGYQSV